MNINFLLLSMLLGLFLLPVKAQNVTSTATVSSTSSNNKTQTLRDTTTIQLINDDHVTVLRSDIPGKQVVLSNPVAKRKQYFGCPDVVPVLCAPRETPTIAPTPPPIIEVKPEVKPEVIGKPFFLPDPVFFRINKYVIDASEWAKIELAVNYLNEHPEATCVVTGYADKKTGNTKINLKLSEQRSNAVAKAMQTKYGINKNRISINWKGDGLQPFQLENDKNRAVLFLINP